MTKYQNMSLTSYGPSPSPYVCLNTLSDLASAVTENKEVSDSFWYSYYPQQIAYFQVFSSIIFHRYSPKCNREIKQNDTLLKLSKLENQISSLKQREPVSPLHLAKS